MASQQQQQQQQHQQELAASDPQPIARELPSDLPPQPSEHHLVATSTGTDTDASPRHPFSDEHAEIAPDVRVAAPNTNTEAAAAAEGSPNLGKEARHSTSVVSRSTDRGPAANDVGEGEGTSAAGAVTVANEHPDVDPNLQARAVSAEEELRQKATIGKEQRTFFSFFTLVRL
jgi:hypothetical protein